VISRADEIGGGRVDAMVSARQVARRYRTEPALRGLCQDVVAVAGLLAETSRTLHQVEFTALAELAVQPREALDASLLTAERFLNPPADASPSPEVRRRLLARLGIFGLRLGTALVRQGVDSPAALAAELLDRSGLHDLQRVLDTQFVGRRDLLKARSALLALLTVLDDVPAAADGARLAVDVERILANAHEFVELRLLGALRSGAVTLPDALVAEARMLLGEDGAGAAARLGQPPGTPAPVLREAALDALARWQQRAENPMLSRAAADASRTVVRTCEGLLAVAGPPSPTR
jgi:hypothetical protein